MNAKRRKAIDHAKKSFEAHIGHTITMGLSGETFVLAAVVLIGENVMLRREGEPFATIYSDIYFRECSCGEGKKK